MTLRYPQWDLGDGLVVGAVGVGQAVLAGPLLGVVLAEGDNLQALDSVEPGNLAGDQGYSHSSVGGSPALPLDQMLDQEFGA